MSDMKWFTRQDGVEMVSGQADILRQQLTKMAERSRKKQKQNTALVEGQEIQFAGALVGISLLQLDAVCLKDVHDIGCWEGTACHVTKLSEQLGSSFAMVPTHAYKHPPHLRNTKDAPAQRKIVGVHYSFVPLANMPKAALLQKLDDLMAFVCRPKATAVVKPLCDAWPPEAQTPSDPFIIPALYALRALRFSDAEADINVKVRAGLEYITLSAEDMSLDDLLEVPAQAAFVSYALDRYEPPKEDPYLLLKCDVLSERLYEALYGDSDSDSSADDSSEHVGAD